MGISLSVPQKTPALVVNHVSESSIEKRSEASTVGSVCINGRNLERSASGSLTLKGRDLGITASGSTSFKTGELERNASGSISFKGSNKETVSVESINLKGIDLATSSLGPISFKAEDLEDASRRVNSCNEIASEVSRVGLGSFKEEAAAVKLQKVYKSYRTRRNLADCAVVVEELWWQAIDFVTLKRSTVSFFDIEKPQTASSRWLRARIKAAKVGKGLSKDDKARKLAFQHWLEAIDPRHRYGHNLHFYYDAWFDSDTMQPFFYWLDVGDGRDLNLDCCLRSKMQHQCIKYLGPKEREQYEVIVDEGKLVYKLSGQPVDTAKGSKGTKWIFVLSTSKNFYVGQKKKGTFQHSSFLAGGATSAAGRLVVDDGVLKSIWPYSGHYLPTEENFKEFISFLEENRVNLTDVQMSPTDEDEQSFHLGKSSRVGSDPNREAAAEEHCLCEKIEKIDSHKECTGNDSLPEEKEAAATLCTYAENSETEIRSRVAHDQCVETYEESCARCIPVREGSLMKRTDCDIQEADKTDDQDNQEQVCYKRSLSDKTLEEQTTEVPRELLLQRLNSKKALLSYQLGKQLSLKWSTGAGPRIICVADYPAELRVKALEKVNLSPRSMPSNSPREFPDPSKQKR